MSMTGIYGEPLELIKTWLQSLTAFASFSPDSAVYLYERLGNAEPPEAGEAWAILSYPQDGHSITIVPALDVQRQPEMCLVRVVSGITEAAKEALVNDVGDIVAGLMAAAEPTGQLTQIKFRSFNIDETSDPPQIGAVFRLALDLGGR